MKEKNEIWMKQRKEGNKELKDGRKEETGNKRQIEGKEDEVNKDGIRKKLIKLEIG